MHTLIASALVGIFGGIFNGISKSVTDALILGRSRVTTLTPDAATLKFTPGVPTGFKVTITFPKDVRSAETLRLALGTPVPMDAA